MDDFADAFMAAIMLIVELDRDLAEIVALSLKVSLPAVGLAAAGVLPVGAALASFRFPGGGPRGVVAGATTRNAAGRVGSEMPALAWYRAGRRRGVTIRTIA